MGIFILFICIFIIGCVLSRFYEKYDFVDFLSFLFRIISVIGIIICLFIIIGNKFFLNGDIKANQERYNTLIYEKQLVEQNKLDQLGINTLEVIEDIKNWNEDLAKGKENSQNFWINWYWSKDFYNYFNFIELPNIN